METAVSTNHGAQVRQRIIEFVHSSPEGRLAFLDGYQMWREPLVRFADGDDSLFTRYKAIIAPDHLTPREALAMAPGTDPGCLPARISVISWILPITEKTRQSNRLQKHVPSRLWSHTRHYGEKCNDALRRYVVALLEDLGYRATAPVLQPYFKAFSSESGPYSNWSERHVAYAAGQGTFSLSDGFITEGGIAHRCGSVVTDMPIAASPRPAAHHLANCLFYAGTNCRACIKRCPAGAISESGHDKNRCSQYLNDIGYTKEAMQAGYNNETSVAGCGLCQTKVPCEFGNPTMPGGK